MENRKDIDTVLFEYYRNRKDPSIDVSVNIKKLIEQDSIKAIKRTICLEYAFIGISLLFALIAPLFWAPSSQIIDAVMKIWEIPSSVSESAVAGFSITVVSLLAILLIQTMKIRKSLKRG